MKKVIADSLIIYSGKIGYGTVSEALAYKLPFVFVRRDYFNEEPFLRNMLEVPLIVSHCSFTSKLWLQISFDPSQSS